MGARLDCSRRRPAEYVSSLSGTCLGYGVLPSSAAATFLLQTGTLPCLARAQPGCARGRAHSAEHCTLSEGGAGEGTIRIKCAAPIRNLCWPRKGTRGSKLET